MVCMHTNFDLVRINESLGYYHCKNYNLDLPDSVSSYAEFVEKLPIKYDQNLRVDALRLLNADALNGCSFTISSATSSEHKLLAQRIWRSITPDSYPYQLVAALLRLGVFNIKDIVANIFSAGGMSTLYDGCNRLLEGCKTAILPIGRLDAYPHLIKTFLQLMEKTRVNTLFGTPSSIIQCARLSKENEINLRIRKAVFTGEMFTDVKRSYVNQIFPNMQVYGLYGHSETGFIGVATPRCQYNYYHLITDFFFVEITKKSEVLITDLTKPVIPLFRYNVGDLGELMDGAQLCPCGNNLPVMLLKSRCDKKFNYMGNLIEYQKIKKIVSTYYQKSVDIQVQLSTNDIGYDLLNIVIDDEQANLDLVRARILEDLMSLNGIREGIEKGAGMLEISSGDQLILSYRQKVSPIHDNR